MRSAAIAWASGEIIQVRKSLMIFALAGSLPSFCTSSQVKEAIGYEAAPGALVMDTRKSVSVLSLVPAAAAVTISSDGSTKLPAEFLISP